MQPFKGFIGPEFDTKVQITENGVKYIVNVEVYSANYSISANSAMIS